MSQTVLLGEVATFINGVSFKSVDFVSKDNAGVASLPVFKMGNISPGGGIKEGKADYIPALIASKIDKQKTRPNDILMSMTDMKSTMNLLGYSGQIKNEVFAVNQRVGIVRPIERKVNPIFLYYYLNSPKCISAIRRTARSGVQVNLSSVAIKKTELLLPSRKKQDQIADILKTIDDKIELNRRMNETLEQMGQALFKHYFIDNPEVKTWPEGGINKFARNMRKSEKPPFDNGTVYVGLEHFTRKSLAIYSWGQATDVNSNKSTFSIGDLLFGKLRPYFHKVAIAPVSGVCSTDVLVVRANDATYQGFVYHFLNQMSLISYVTQTSEGTRMPRTSWKNIEGFRFRIPPIIKVKEFSSAVRPFHELIIRNVMETRQLNELRGSLLPRLISGKIEV